jgi:hypothetical protein
VLGGGGDLGEQADARAAQVADLVQVEHDRLRAGRCGQQAGTRGGRSGEVEVVADPHDTRGGPGVGPGPPW